MIYNCAFCILVYTNLL